MPCGNPTYAKLPFLTAGDRARLEVVAGGPLQPGYWKLATAHRGEALDQDLVQDPGFEAFVLPPERLGKAKARYSVLSALEDVMPHYPTRLLGSDRRGARLRLASWRASA